MMNKNIILSLIFSTFSLLFADAPDWSVSAGDFEFPATISGAAVYDQDGALLGDSGDMFAAFGEDGSVRGVGTQITPSFGPFNGETLYRDKLIENELEDIESQLHYYGWYD